MNIYLSLFSLPLENIKQTKKVFCPEILLAGLLYILVFSSRINVHFTAEANLLTPQEMKNEIDTAQFKKRTTIRTKRKRKINIHVDTFEERAT